MKKSTHFTLFSTLIASFILYSNLNAQRLIVGGSTTDIVTVNTSSVRVSNLFIIDSIDQGMGGAKHSGAAGKMHLASFEIDLGNAEATNMVKTLYSAMGGQPLPPVIISRLNSQGQSKEVRTYSSVTLKEIVFPEFNADTREPAKVKVIIKAESVFYDDAPKGMIQSTDAHKSKLPANRFTLVMGDLPTQRVSRISNLRIVASSKQEGVARSNEATEPGYFSIDVASVDAKRWSDWFNNGGGQGTNKEALIGMQDEIASNNIFSLKLSEVEIVSVSVTSNRGGIAITTIGLKATNAPIIQ